MVRVVSKTWVLVVCIFWMMSPNALQAKDFGTHGAIYAITEEDPVVLIQQKLKAMEESGELKRHHQDLQQKTRAVIERPRSISGITKTSQKRVFIYDPTYIVKDDIRDHQGKMIYSRGTKINPLETVTLSQDLLFFDGDDEKQLNFVKTKLQDNNDKAFKLILVKGTPLELSKELNQHVYFDQRGILIKKLGIRHVPAVVTQENHHLRIEEVALDVENK